MSARFNDDTPDELRDVFRVIFAPRRDRTAGNVPLYREREQQCRYCHEPLTAPERCLHCGAHQP